MRSSELKPFLVPIQGDKLGVEVNFFSEANVVTLKRSREAEGGVEVGSEAEGTRTREPSTDTCIIDSAKLT